MASMLKFFTKDPLGTLDEINSEILFTDPSRKILHANRSFLEKFETDLETILHKRCEDVLRPINRQCTYCGDHKGVNCEVVKDGECYSLLVDSSKIGDECIVKIIQDITRMMKSIDELSKKVSELQAIVEASLGERDILTICAECKKMRLKDGSWIYPQDISKIKLKNGLTHGLCPVCADKALGQIASYREYKETKKLSE